MKPFPYILALIFFVGFAQSIFCMEDRDDYLILKGDTIVIRSFPLEEYFPNNEKPSYLFSDKELIEYQVKDYSAYWELRNDSLFLKRIIVEEEDVLYSKLFKANGHEVFASWFNRSIVAHSGERITFMRFENEQIFKFSKGLVVKEEKNIYSIYKRSEYTEDWEKLKDYIARNIDYSKHDEPYEKARVYVKILQVTENGKIDSVSIMRGWDKLRDEEAIRVVKSIPSWPVIHKNGKQINEEWAIAVVFGNKIK